MSDSDSKTAASISLRSTLVGELVPSDELDELELGWGSEEEVAAEKELRDERELRECCL